MKSYWHMSTEAAVEELKTHASNGLAVHDIAALRSRYGFNQLKEAQGRSPLMMFLDQFKGMMIWILIAAAIVSGFLNEWIDAIAIAAIVVLNALLGFVQEFRAEKSLAALKKLSSPNAKVIRGGQKLVVPTVELVPGDLVEIEAGDSVPSDCRLAWITSNFSVQEAPLTGESMPVLKTVFALSGKEVPLAERANMIYMGTSVSSGRGRAVVTEIGMQTELGKIAGMIQTIEQEQTPLQRKLDEFGKWIIWLCFILVALVFVAEWLHGMSLVDVFLTSVSLAVAAIPEGLPAVVTIALALGVQRMVKRHALIRKLSAVETLGCATVICSDKTGTLTKNEMTVQAVYAGDVLFNVTGIGYEPKGQFVISDVAIVPKSYPDLMETLRAGVLCNGAQLVQKDSLYKIMGDPTEGALLTVAAKAGLTQQTLDAQSPFLDEIPFDSDRKCMTVIRNHAGKRLAFVKGAPDILLSLCSSIMDHGRQRTMTVDDRLRIAKTNELLAGAAMRVLAVAERELGADITKYDSEKVETALTFVGLVAMIDPPREEVKAAMRACKTADIKTVMITGDHKNTAVAIAKELGFFSTSSLAYTGEELDRLSDDDLHRQITNVAVYARVSPEHKLRIVRAWRNRNEVVAMTGDGVNDAPAVKEANIGVAMGITGTDVTKEVAGMVVTDDNFASIVAAVEEGRGIYDNIKKFIHFLLSCNAGEIMVMFVASMIGMPPPLLPIHILWVNLVTDGIPALALGVDPVDPDIMSRKSRKPDESVVSRAQVGIILIQGAFIAVCSLGAFWFVYAVEGHGLERARTAAFVVLVCAQLVHAFNCRSLTDSIFKVGVFTNMKLVAAAVISFGLQMCVVYVPFCQRVFKTESLPLIDWVVAVGVSLFVFFAVELVKLVNRMTGLKMFKGQ